MIFQPSRTVHLRRAKPPRPSAMVGDMKWPQFSLRDLLLAVTLLAMGGKGWWVATERILAEYPSPVLWIAGSLAAGGAIGAGVLAPLQLKRWGAAIGVLSQICFLGMLYVLARVLARALWPFN